MDSPYNWALTQSSVCGGIICQHCSTLGLQLHLSPRLNSCQFKEHEFTHQSTYTQVSQVKYLPHHGVSKKKRIVIPDSCITITHGLDQHQTLRYLVAVSYDVCIVMIRDLKFLPARCLQAFPYLFVSWSCPIPARISQ